MKVYMKQNFILLPVKTTHALKSEDKSLNPEVKNFFYKLSSPAKTKRLHLHDDDKPLPIKVLDSVSESGAKLVELPLDSLANFQFSFPGIRLVPEVFYKKAIMPSLPLTRLFSAAASKRKSTTVTVTNDQGEPITDASIYAYVDYEKETGIDGKTDERGKLQIRLSKTVKRLEVLLVYPPHSYWPLCLKNVSLEDAITIKVRAIDVTYEDVLRHFYKTPTLPHIRKTIKIGIVDTGIGPHTSLDVEGGACTVAGERKNDYADCDNHGTHVAGIIGSKQDPVGVAAGVQLYSYRVFPKDGGDASSFSIIKAISKAVEDGCQLINLSIALDESDEATNAQIAEAYSKGVICFAAAGNDGRQAVSYPAAYSLAIAVSAMGRRGTFPAGTEPFIDVKSPYGKDPKNFIAGFSNIGHEIKITAPGVGIMSCYPGNKFQVLSGTSMACPAAVGIAARLLAEEGRIIKRTASAQRADEMIRFLHSKLRQLGFGARYEGQGMFFV
jgi:subtilisin family serine protease